MLEALFSSLPSVVRRCYIVEHDSDETEGASAKLRVAIGGVMRQIVSRGVERLPVEMCSRLISDDPFLSVLHKLSATAVKS